jgi:hypothetical protein
MLPVILAANKPGKEREPLPEIRKIILDAILLWSALLRPVPLCLCLLCVRS